MAWTYDDLKGYDPRIIYHTIDIDEGSKII